MRSLLTFLTLLSPAVLGLVQVQHYDGQSKPGHYIVKYKEKPASSAKAGIATGSNLVSLSIILPEGAQKYEHVFSGFAAKLSDDQLEKLRNDPAVETIWQDGYAYTQGVITQNDAPWGLERISHAPKVVQHADPLTYNYTRQDVAGQGVDVYILDTGINVDHVQFEGRAELGPAFGYSNSNDDNGHGTHVAGIVGSKQFGVAKKVHLIAIKVLGEDGRGSWSNIISGLDWVALEAAKRLRPSIVNISIAGGKHPAADEAVERVVTLGTHVTVAAGNFGTAVSETSPARAPGALTVGATDINDTFVDFSNYGPEIDVNAPGASVLSTYTGSITATASLSGTSMAAPHVAGLIAYFISLYGNCSPANMSDFIKNKAIKGAISGLKGDTPNLLAFNGVESLKRRGYVTRRDLHSLLERKNRLERFSRRK